MSYSPLQTQTSRFSDESDYPLKSLKHSAAWSRHWWWHRSTWPTFPQSPWRRWHHGRSPQTRRGRRRDRRFAHDVGGWTSGPSGCAMDVTGAEHWRKVTPLTAERIHCGKPRKLPRALPKCPEGPRKVPRISWCISGCINLFKTL